MAKFGLKIANNKLAIIETNTRDVCVPPIEPKHLSNIVHDLKFNHHQKYDRKDTETHYKLYHKNIEVVHVAKEHRSDLVNFIDSLCLLVTDEEIHLP